MLKFCYRYAKTTHHCSSLLTSPSPSHKQKKLSSGTQNLRFNLLTACIHAETFLLYSLNMGHVIWKYSWTLSSNAKYVFFPPLLILESFVVVYFWFFWFTASSTKTTYVSYSNQANWAGMKFTGRPAGWDLTNRDFTTTRIQSWKYL